MNTCPTHGVPWKTVPAGVSSKTGQPYNAFLACPVQGCRQRPPKNGSQAAPQASVNAPGPQIGTSPGSEAILELAKAIRYLADKLPDKNVEWPEQ